MRILELDGAVEYMNSRGLELLEITAFERNRGRPWQDLWPAESRPLLAAALVEARRGGVGHFTAQCPTAKGRIRWWQTSVSPVRDVTGKVVRLLATSRDVTREVRREDALRRALRRARSAAAAKASYLAYLKEALEVLPAGLAFYDAEDRLVVWNQAYVAAGGADDGRTKIRAGMTFADLLRADLAAGRHPDAEGRHEAWIADCLAARHRAAEPREQQLACGRWYRFEDRRLLDGGIVSVAVDITDLHEREAGARRAAEALASAKAAAEAASAAKSEFLANMSHEIRTPLNGVIAVADLLCRRDLEGEERRLAELIRSSGEALERLLSDVLDLAKIESGALEIERVAVHLGALVRSVSDLARLKAEEKALRLTVVIDPELDRPVWGDPTRLRQVMTNLIYNAVKFTPAGEIEVRVKSTPDGRARLEVQDTGVGFDPAEKERLFRRFEQADGSITRQFGGSGLGLAICAQLAALMGGALDCRSSPGQGSTFWIDIPADPAEPHLLPPQERAAPLEKEGLRVLLADDHPTNRMVLDLMVKGLGGQTTCVENGLEALRAFCAAPFDLVLMDMQMPVMDGLTAIREIRAWEAAERRPPSPVLMLTANTMPAHVSAALEAGANGHLGKPLTVDRLVTGITEALATARRPLQAAPALATQHSA